MYSAAEVTLGYHAVDAEGHVSLIWDAGEAWVIRKRKATATGGREPNFFGVGGVHPAAFYKWMFDNGLQNLLVKGKLHIVSLHQR